MGSGEWGSTELTRRFLDFYNQQLGVLEELYQRQSYELDKMPDSRLDALYPLLFSTHQTGTCISILSSQGGYLNECLVLARALLERLITYIYLLFCDEKEYLKYLAYTKQKGFRSLNRTVKVGDLEARLRWLGSIDLRKEPELKQALELFTSKKGKRITRWTSVRLEDMLATIADRGAIEISFLMMALLWIYEDASEAMHGTLYGSIFHTGLFSTGVPSTRDKLEKTWLGQLTALFLVLGTSIHSLTLAVHKVLPIRDITDKSRNNLKGIKGLIS